MTDPTTSSLTFTLWLAILGGVVYGYILLQDWLRRVAEVGRLVGGYLHNWMKERQ